ncbi:MAG TPA: DUF3857 domain-containing protein [Chitinophagaceae bacterium]|nr:DUF3857 domain-containing protein [Chitinophagaceae bacterium]
MKAILAFIVFCLLIMQAEAGGDYAVSNIPVALLKNSDAVLRNEELRFEIISTREAVQKYHYVMTILNENGDDWAGFSEYYDKLQDVSSVEGYLYDAAGKQLKKMKSKDLEDLSGVSGISLIDDNRIKRHNFYYKVYPYTVEYFVEVRYKHTMYFPKWIPQGGEKLAVEKSQVTIVCPEDYQFRYKVFHYSGNPVIAAENKKRSTTWSVSNMPAIVREAFQPPLHEVTTVAIFGPTEFQIGDYKGNMQSWQDFGKFIHALKQGRDVLPESIKSEIRRLTDGISDEKKKIQVLYEYMQKNTRYISIQLGIGGWQPFDANFVASKSYGDCKALSNYMYSILKEAGIRSVYAVVRAGRNSTYITDEFPSQQFNHAILCVPLQKDSMWLECTSQTLPAGYMSGFTGNRYALAVDETGGTLVSTPRYGLKENVQLKKINAVLDENATLQVRVRSIYEGVEQDELHMMINGLSKEKLKEYLHDQLDFATYDINNFNYTQNKSSLPGIDESLDITVSNYATVTGKRIFIVPNVMTRTHTKLPADTARKYDLELSVAHKDVDSVEIELPKGYAAEAMPEDVSITSKFGKYNCSVKLRENKLFYYRTIESYSGRFPAKDYNDLTKFYEMIYKADRNKVVLVKNEKQEEKKAF